MTTKGFESDNSVPEYEAPRLICSSNMNHIAFYDKETNGHTIIKIWIQVSKPKEDSTLPSYGEPCKFKVEEKLHELEKDYKFYRMTDISDKNLLFLIFRNVNKG